MSRRHFLLQTSSLALGGLSLSRWALAAPANTQATPSSPRLLFVLLRGGLDTDSVLFQHNNDFYYEKRPTIAVARKGWVNEDQRLNDQWAVHPALSPLWSLLERKQMAFVPFTGVQDNSRSHFTAQNLLERGMVGDQPLVNTGLLNRMVGALAQQHGNLGGVNFAGGVPTICVGPEELPYVNARQGVDPKVGELFDQKLQTLQSLYLDPQTHERLKAVSAKQTGARDTLRAQMTADMSKAHGASAQVSPGLQGQFEQMARLMKAGGAFSVGFMDVNGWDTHQGQGNEVGWLSGRLLQLSEAIAAYVQGMGEAWPHTHVVLMSEFGRTFAENGTRGTDHGHGSTMMLLSGRPYRDSVLGEQVIYRPETLHEQRDTPILNPYRQVLLDHVLLPLGLPKAAAKKALLIS